MTIRKCKRLLEGFAFVRLRSCLSHTLCSSSRFTDIKTQGSMLVIELHCHDQCNPIFEQSAHTETKIHGHESHSQYNLSVLQKDRFRLSCTRIPLPEIVTNGQQPGRNYLLRVRENSSAGYHGNNVDHSGHVIKISYVQKGLRCWSVKSNLRCDDVINLRKGEHCQKHLVIINQNSTRLLISFGIIIPTWLV